MNKLSFNLFVFSLTSLILSLVLVKSFDAKNVKAVAGHLVISEVQIEGESSSDDFIEIYNPTESDVDLSSLRLVKRTSTGATNDSIVAFESGDTIAAHGFYLWCNNALSEALGCDKSTGGTVSNDNSVALSNDPLDGVVIDAVTFGSPANPLGEGTFLEAPTASSSAERKAGPSSDTISMGVGGTDEFAGNGEDTDNNANDFILRTISDPQNSSSSLEPELGSPAPSPSTSPSVEPSPTPEESAEPSPSPSSDPSEDPSPTPEESPSPEPSESPEPSPSPSPEVSPSVSPSPEASPSATPSPTPSSFSKVIGWFGFPNKTRVCVLTYQVKNLGFFSFFFPKIFCHSV